MSTFELDFIGLFYLYVSTGCFNYVAMTMEYLNNKYVGEQNK